jgi:PAS domain S-box-containing protein
MEFADLMRRAQRLRFPDELEQLFQADYYRKSIVTMRIGLVLGIALVALFGILDIWAAPLALDTIWAIRYLVLCPVFGAVLLLTFAPFFARAMQPLITLAVVAAGLGIAAMSGVTSPQEPAYTSYYAGLLLVIMWGYTFIRLRFWYAALAGVIIMAGYEVVAIGYQHLLASAMGRLAFASNNFFFVSANILGMFVGYFIELYARRDFVQRRAIEATAARASEEHYEKLYQLNEELEQRVDERTAQLAAALTERTRLTDILEETSDMVAFASLDGTILYFNRAGRRIAGLSDDADVTGFSFADFYPPAALELIATVGLPTALRDGTWSGETVVKGQHGDEIPVSLVGIVHRTPDGTPTHLSAIIRDISERKRAEAALQQAKEAAEEATRAKSTFLANMSHEIRTPMNGIIGMTDLLLDTDLSLAQRDFIETIRASGDALLTIINDILDFSKIEAGKLDLEEQPFDLRDCVESALDLLAHRAAEKRLDLAVQFDANTPAAIVGDVVRLRQILVNLLANAIKFTERGEVVVSVRRQEPASDNLQSAICNLQFSVKDTGIGIPPDRIDQLFQSFSQVDPSTTRKYGGTGLGLVISQRLAELMGGRMWVESAPGEGSTFHFTIHAPVATNAPPVYLRGDQPQLRGKHLLVVDDNPTNRTIVCHQVASWGMTCEQAASGDEALVLLQAGHTFDLAILDMHMPDMDGVELAHAIRRWESGQGPRMEDRGSRMATFDPRSSIFHPPTSPLPLVMLTSLGQRQTSTHEPVFAAVLTKPVKASQLYNALAAVFMGHSPAFYAANDRAAFDTDMGARLPLRILLAEDNLINQKVALLELERLGYAADVAANGHEVLAAVERASYDVVLMDVHMPVLDGLQATRQIRASRDVAGGRQPWIIAMTANAMQGDRELCLAAGMDDYIAKPVHIHELRAAIERAGKKAEGGKMKAEALDTEAVHPSAEPAVDWAALAEFCRAGSADELIALFLADAPPALAALHAAVAHRDAAGLREAAHSLKGSSTYMGARGLAARLADLERIGRGGSVEGAAAVLAHLEDEFERVRQALTEERPV